MAPKKSQQRSSIQSDLYVILRDSTNASSRVVPQDKLTYAKKDNLKLGTSAMFKEDGKGSSRFQGTVVMAGSKEQCENALLLIDNTAQKQSRCIEDNDERSKELADSDQLEKPDDDSQQQYQENRTTVASMPIAEEIRDLPSTSVSSAVSPTPVLSNSQSTSTDQTRRIIPGGDVDRSDIIDDPNNTSKRKESSGDVSSGTKRMKRSGDISHSHYEKIKRENVHLKKQLNTIRTNWMPKPLGAAATYFVDMGRVLSGKSENSDDEMEKGDLLETICSNLDISESELKKCEHRADITKTCRLLTKYIYRDVKKRASELVSTMNPKILKAIQDYARLAHPVQARTPNSVLNNAIGNVFAAEKRKSDQEDIEMVDSDEIHEDSDVDEPTAED